MRALLALCLLGGPALAADPSLLRRFDHEPSVRALQRAAARYAEVQPERVRSWLRRVNAAAILPTFRARAGRGAINLSVRGLDTYLDSSDAWRFDFEATWSLDRLVFDRSEIGISRESQRIAQRREQLLTHVAELYFQRRRLQLEAAEAGETAERRLAIDELTAILDGLTGGAMSECQEAR